MNNYCDVHIHLFDLFKYEKKLPQNTFFLTSAYNKTEFLFQEELSRTIDEQNQVFLSFGIHPQLPDFKEIDFLKELLVKKRISAIGEIGFDLYEEKFSSQLDKQIKVWEKQLELAVEFKIPIIIHSRKALPVLFKYSSVLAKVPYVIFHSWSGSPTEAFSFLSRGIKAYFSIGKSLLQGNKRAISSVNEIPITFLLTETDAPYQTLKNQKYGSTFDIIEIVKKISEIKKITEEEVKKKVFESFSKIFIQKK